MFGEDSRAVSFLPFLVACAVLIFFAVAFQLDRKHEYYAHLSSVFFVETPKPAPVPVAKQLSEVFVNLRHPRTKMTAILQGMDPAIVLVNATTSILDPVGATCKADLNIVDGPGGLVAGRDKVGAAAQVEELQVDGAVPDAGVTEASDPTGPDLLSGQESKVLEHSLPLSELAERALAWRTWSRGRLFWNLFEKYQPVLAARFPSLRLGSAIRSVYVGVSISGMCFLNALFFEHGKGIPQDPRCKDAEDITSHLAILNALVSVVCKVGILFLVTSIVSKDVCYEYPDWKRLATVHKWETKEKIAITLGALYLLITSSYVAVFLFMIPHYAAYTYLEATCISIAVIEIVKPFSQAALLTVVLKSKYGNCFAAHFPQLSDFSHLHVLEDAEFTHSHWAELTRVLNSPTETE